MITDKTFLFRFILPVKETKVTSFILTLKTDYFVEENFK